MDTSTPTSARISNSSSSSHNASSITCWVNRLVTREKTPSRVLVRLSRNGFSRLSRSNMLLVYLGEIQRGTAKVRAHFRAGSRGEQLLFTQSRRDTAQLRC